MATPVAGAPSPFFMGHGTTGGMGVSGLGARRAPSPRLGPQQGTPHSVVDTPASRTPFRSRPPPSGANPFQDRSRVEKPPTMTFEDELAALDTPARAGLAGHDSADPTAAAADAWGPTYRAGEVQSAFKENYGGLGPGGPTPSRGYDGLGLDDPYSGHHSGHGAGFLAGGGRGGGNSGGYADGGSDSPKWITVFGFPLGAEDTVERYFQQFGSMIDHKLTPNNWLHIQYERAQDADMVLEKNGICGVVEGHMLGVKPCDDPEVLSGSRPLFDAARDGVHSRARARSRSLTPHGRRTPGQHRLLRNARTSFAQDGATNLYKRRPRQANICMRLFRFLCGFRI